MTLIELCGSVVSFIALAIGLSVSLYLGYSWWVVFLCTVFSFIGGWMIGVYLLCPVVMNAVDKSHANENDE